MKYCCILFLFLSVSSVSADSFELRANKLIDSALEIEQEQIKHIGLMRRSLVRIDKDIATLRDSSTGCLILDDKCSHEKHLEWQKNYKKKHEEWKAKEAKWQADYDKHWDELLKSKGWK